MLLFFPSGSHGCWDIITYPSVDNQSEKKDTKSRCSFFLFFFFPSVWFSFSSLIKAVKLVSSHSCISSSVAMTTWHKNIYKRECVWRVIWNKKTQRSVENVEIRPGYKHTSIPHYPVKWTFYYDKTTRFDILTKTWGLGQLISRFSEQLC